MSSDMIKTLVTVILMISGGIGWAVTHFADKASTNQGLTELSSKASEHVLNEDFKQYIEQEQLADEREYVRQLKKDIRDINFALVDDPDNQYLLDELDDLIFLLCELRPNDKVCIDED